MPPTLQTSTLNRRSPTALPPAPSTFLSSPHPLSPLHLRQPFPAFTLTTMQAGSPHRPLRPLHTSPLLPHQYTPTSTLSLPLKPHAASNIWLRCCFVYIFITLNRPELNFTFSKAFFFNLFLFCCRASVFQENIHEMKAISLSIHTGTQTFFFFVLLLFMLSSMAFYLYRVFISLEVFFFTGNRCSSYLENPQFVYFYWCW